MTLHRPRYCGLLLSVAAWTLAAATIEVGAQTRRTREPPPRPATLLLPAELAWTTALPSAAVAAGADVGPSVVVPLDSGELYAVDRATGEMRWVEPLRTSIAPVASGSLVVAASEASVAAFDAASGARQWSHTLGGAPTALVGAGRSVYVLDPQSITALDGASGQTTWTQRLDCGPTTLAAGPSSLAVTCADARVVTLSRTDGHPIWTRQLTGTLSTPSWSLDVLVVGSSDRSAWGLDAKNGGIKWRWPLRAAVSGVAADRDRVFLGTLDNLLHAVNRGNGHQRWQQDIGTRAQDAPVALDGAVLVAGLSPALTLYDSKTGTPLGTYEAPGKPLGPPLVDRSLRPGGISVVILLRDGRLLGLRSTGLSFRELPVTALPGLPGRTLPRERLPQPAP